MTMESWYDEEEDILGMVLADKPYWKSVEAGNVVLDLSHDGTIIGIDIMKASEILEDVPSVLESLQAKNA
jgi:uncharacterized protein YuzE